MCCKDYTHTCLVIHENKVHHAGYSGHAYCQHPSDYTHNIPKDNNYINNNIQNQIQNLNPNNNNNYNFLIKEFSSMKEIELEKYKEHIMKEMYIREHDYELSKQQEQLIFEKKKQELEKNLEIEEINDNTLILS